MAKQNGKIVSVEDAVQLIQDKDTVATGGFVGAGFAEELAIGLEDSYTRSGHPRDLTLIYAAGQGDGKDRGLNHFGRLGMVKRVIGGHWGLVPKLQKLAIENRIEAYNLPQGVISHMFRDIAAHKPRTITRVGLGTFVDPRKDGGKIGSLTKDDIVDVIVFDEQEYLAYHLPEVNAAILRGTTADTDGNITMEKEALTLEALSIAMAAKNSGGVVIVQVERVAEKGALDPRQVKIPGILVDRVVVASEEHHDQTFACKYDPALSCEIKVPLEQIEPMPLNIRKVIARRACLEIKIGSVINLGIGMPEGISRVAAEEGVLDLITLTTEPGAIGGVPVGGLNFGASVNMEALIDQPYQFDYYDGGGLDLAFLGMAQADRHGNLNVSKFGPNLAGAGGFINISQNAKKVCFLGTFTAGAAELKVENGRLRIDQDGRMFKFIEEVEHITYSGKTAAQAGQPALYITERAVFSLSSAGLELIEIAPGIDIQRDVLDKMDFEPKIPQEPAVMDWRIFMPELMGLKDEWNPNF